MIFTASRGQAFREEFTFKNDKGKPQNVPAGDYRLLLERGGLVREFHPRLARNAIQWVMTADETASLEYATMYFVLTLNGQEIARGVLRVN
jgi:hypothetical protein